MKKMMRKKETKLRKQSMRIKPLLKKKLPRRFEEES